MAQPALSLKTIRGQILIEALVAFLFVLFFLLFLQFFYFRAQEDIQRERLTGGQTVKSNKALWLKSYEREFK